MNTDSLSTLITFVLCSLLFNSVYADSDWGKKEQRFEQRRDMSKSGRQQKHNALQYKNDFRTYSKTLNPGSKTLNPSQDKQDLRGHTKINRKHNRQDGGYASELGRYPRNYSKDESRKNRHIYKDHYGDHRRYQVRHGRHLWLDTPRHRRYRNILVIRPHGHAYHGYGHFLHDHNAWRWLTFTAITLKLLDMVDEQAQREHEAAQVAATTAEVGEQIIWDTEDASGYVVTTREGTNGRGYTCREYQQSITVGGKTEEAYGTACLQPDGAWKIVK